SRSLRSSKLRCFFSSMSAYMSRRVMVGLRVSYSVGRHSPLMRSIGGRPTVISRSDARRSIASFSRSTMSAWICVDLIWSAISLLAPRPVAGRAPRPPLLGGAGEHLLERGDPLERLVDAVVAQRAHAALDGQVAELDRRRLLDDRLLELLVYHQQLVDGVAAVVAAAAALLAADAAVQGLAVGL